MDLHPWTAPGSRPPQAAAGQSLTPYAHRLDRSAWTVDQVGPAAVLRVGELERAAACEALAEHFAAGRLDPAELDDRLARAMAARSQNDLRALFVDLGPRRGVPDAVPPPDPPVRAQGGASGAVAVSLLVISLLLAGGMLLVLGAYNPALFLAALVGGTATAVGGSCVTVLAQAAWRRR